MAATPIDDTYVALAAASVLVVPGALAGSKFTATLGEEFIWLLIGAFVIAAAVTATGLPARVASRLVAWRAPHANSCTCSPQHSS